MLKCPFRVLSSKVEGPGQVQPIPALSPVFCCFYEVYRLLSGGIRLASDFSAFNMPQERLAGFSEML